MRADGMDALPEQPKLSPSIAIISVTMIDGGRFNADDWQKAHGMPVIWVAEAPRAYDSRVYPPEYSHILMLDFTCAELRRLVFGLAGEIARWCEIDAGEGSVDRGVRCDEDTVEGNSRLC